MPTTLTNAKPLVLTGAGGMANDFWTTISVPAGQGKPIWVDYIEWIAPGASATFTITDASTGASVLAEGSTPASYAGPDPVYPINKQWRNFKCTGLTAGTLLIYYH